MKRPTRRDVAERAGVAPSTVSLILNDRSSALGIAEVTKHRVEEAARALGYYPNRHIRAVRSGRTGVLGLYLRSDQWGCATGYWSAMRAALEQAVSEADMQLLLHCARPDCPTEEAFARQAGGVVDGVIILNSGNDPIAARLMETGMRAVEIGDSFSPLPYVAVDGGSGIEQVMRHLAERGYRRPSFINFPSPYEDSSMQRWRAFEAMSEELFGHVGPTFDVDGFDKGLAPLLAWEPRPDVAVCTSDELAFGTLAACRREGLRVPEDLAITGFDCISTLSPYPVMTSVETPMRELARQGVEKLRLWIEGTPAERETILPVRLRVGDTT